MVDFLLHIFGMGELRCKFAVVGEQEHTGGVAVETTHRVDSLGAGVFNEVHNGHAAIGVVACCNAVFRLVEEDVALAFECYHLVLIFNSVFGCDFGSEFGNRSAVHLHKSLCDEFVGFAARADSGVSHEFVQAHFLVWIDWWQFILDALWTRSESHLLARLLLLTTLIVVGAVVGAVVISALVAAVVVTAAVVAISALVASIVVISALVSAVVVSALVSAVVVSAAVVISALVSAVVTITATIVVLVAIAATIVVVAALVVISATVVVFPLRTVVFPLLAVVAALIVAALAIVVVALVVISFPVVRAHRTLCFTTFVCGIVVIGHAFVA